MHIALHIASTRFCMTGIAPPRGLKSQPEKSVCLAVLVNAGIIVLRYPALLSSKRSGHCVFVGTITGLLRRNSFSFYFLFFSCYFCFFSFYFSMAGLENWVPCFRSVSCSQRLSGHKTTKLINNNNNK